MNEKQNTFRVLKEERQLITSIWCYLGLHNWTKWDEPTAGIWKHPISMNRHKVMFQYRCCGNCNKFDRTKFVLGTADGY